MFLKKEVSLKNVILSFLLPKKKRSRKFWFISLQIVIECVFPANFFLMMMMMVILQTMNSKNSLCIGIYLFYVINFPKKNDNIFYILMYINN